MNKDKIYIGNVMKCFNINWHKYNVTKCVLYKECAVLIGISDDCFVDYDQFSSVAKYKRILLCIKNNNTGNLVMNSLHVNDNLVVCSDVCSLLEDDMLFVDAGSLIPISKIEKTPAKVRNKKLIRCFKNAKKKSN